jgi:hypothetical protein
MNRTRCVALAALPLLLVVATVGCEGPWSSVAKIGVKVVGEAVHEVDVDKHAKELVGQPVEKADAEFGQRIETAVDTQSPRELMVYPVKDDLLGKTRWVVEAENSRIVALSKADHNPDGGKDIIKDALLDRKLLNKTPAEFQDEKKFRNPVLTLRSKDTGNLIRVYDVKGITDLLGAKYCVLRFDASDRCQDIRLVGVPASTKKDPAAR